MATSAAPTFFPVFRGVDSVRLVDGGVWANNPTMVSIVEATSVLNIPLKAIKVLNLGTTDEIAKRPPRLDYGGILTWARCKAALDTVMRGQSIAAFNQAGHLIGKEKVLRLSPHVASSDFALDRVRRTQDLIGKASHHSRDFLPQFQREFGQHVAPAYKPLLTKDQKIK